MSDSAAHGVVQVGPEDRRRKIVVSELTVVQMRQVMLLNLWPGEDASPEELADYQLDNFLFTDCRLSDLALMAGLPREELDGCTGSELRKVLAKAKELNPDFFGALERMAAARSNS